MAFLLSRCLGLVTPDPGAAMAFYVSTFGMEPVGEETIELNAGPLTFFIDPGKTRPMVFELITDDLADARLAVRSFGFEELVWRGPDQSCLIRDPFGLVLNVYEDRSLFTPMDLEPPDDGYFKACIGALSPAPCDLAEFYSQVLDAPYSRLPGGSYIVDSGPVRLRFRRGVSTTPMVWLKPDAPVDQFGLAGCMVTDAGVMTDPYGVNWCTETMVPAPRAAVCPL